jgi:hypothetical protein
VSDVVLLYDNIRGCNGNRVVVVRHRGFATGGCIPLTCDRSMPSIISVSLSSYLLCH